MRFTLATGVLGLTPTIYHILDRSPSSTSGGRLCWDRPWAGNGLIPAPAAATGKTMGSVYPDPLCTRRRDSREPEWWYGTDEGSVICMRFILRASVAADRVQRHRLIVIMADAFWGKVAAQSHQRSARSCIRRHTHNAFHHIVGNSDNILLLALQIYCFSSRTTDLFDSAFLWKDISRTERI